MASGFDRSNQLHAFADGSLGAALGFHRRASHLAAGLAGIC
jgi:hypothetical protein